MSSPTTFTTTCTVQTQRSYMTAYVWLYIIGVAIFLTAFIVQRFVNPSVAIFDDIMIAGGILVFIATIIWGLDRRCRMPSTSVTGV